MITPPATITMMPTAACRVMRSWYQSLASRAPMIGYSRAATAANAAPT
jgi:hypothetical protein